MLGLMARIDDDGTVAVVRDGLAAASAAEMAARGRRQTSCDLPCAGGAGRARRLVDFGGNDSRGGDDRLMSGLSTSRRDFR
jgi:hypothetical protein